MIHEGEQIMTKTSDEIASRVRNALIDGDVVLHVDLQIKLGKDKIPSTDADWEAAIKTLQAEGITYESLGSPARSRFVKRATGTNIYPLP